MIYYVLVVAFLIWIGMNRYFPDILAVIFCAVIVLIIFEDIVAPLLRLS